MKKLVEVKILPGSRSIGGNFVRIKDGDRTLIFDQGIRFDIMSNYYSTFITPRGTSELRDLGILPKAEWYEDASGIYVMHAVLYSGDFRVESFLSQDEFSELKGGQDLLNFLRENPDIRVDPLIIEGTNIGSTKLPVAPKEAIDIFACMQRIASSHKFVIATLHGLDLEYAYTLMKLAVELDLNCNVASSRIGWTLIFQKT